MAFEYLGANALDYEFCSYGESNRKFRGPRLDLDGDYDVVIGGTETFGKFVELPFPVLLAKHTGIPAVNFGQMYSGAGYLLGDMDTLSLCKRARTAIIQLTGAQNMTNRFYLVHPRRNDRFLRPTRLLSAIFSEVDFTEIHFTGHLMNELSSRCPMRFGTVLNGLQEDWVARMKSLIASLTVPVVLLWMADHKPGHACNNEARSYNPTFITRDMLNQLSDVADHLVEVVAMPEEISAGFLRMVFNPVEEPAAEQMLGPIVHQEVARQLHQVISGL